MDLINHLLQISEIYVHKYLFLQNYPHNLSFEILGHFGQTKSVLLKKFAQDDYNRIVVQSKCKTINKIYKEIFRNDTVVSKMHIHHSLPYLVIQSQKIKKEDSKCITLLSFLNLVTIKRLCSPIEIQIETNMFQVILIEMKRKFEAIVYICSDECVYFCDTKKNTLKINEFEDKIVNFVQLNLECFLVAFTDAFKVIQFKDKLVTTIAEISFDDEVIENLESTVSKQTIYSASDFYSIDFITIVFETSDEKLHVYRFQSKNNNFFQVSSFIPVIQKIIVKPNFELNDENYEECNNEILENNSVDEKLEEVTTLCIEQEFKLENVIKMNSIQQKKDETLCFIRFAVLYYDSPTLIRIYEVYNDGFRIVDDILNETLLLEISKNKSENLNSYWENANDLEFFCQEDSNLKTKTHNETVNLTESCESLNSPELWSYYIMENYANKKIFIKQVINYLYSTTSWKVFVCTLGKSKLLKLNDISGSAVHLVFSNEINLILVQNYLCMEIYKIHEDSFVKLPLIEIPYLRSINFTKKDFVIKMGKMYWKNNNEANSVVAEIDYLSSNDQYYQNESIIADRVICSCDDEHILINLVNQYDEYKFALVNVKNQQVLPNSIVIHENNQNIRFIKANMNYFVYLNYQENSLNVYALYRRKNVDGKEIITSEESGLRIKMHVEGKLSSHELYSLKKCFFSKHNFNHTMLITLYDIETVCLHVIKIIIDHNMIKSELLDKIDIRAIVPTFTNKKYQSNKLIVTDWMSINMESTDLENYLVIYKFSMECRNLIYFYNVSTKVGFKEIKIDDKINCMINVPNTDDILILSERSVSYVGLDSNTVDRISILDSKAEKFIRSDKYLLIIFENNVKLFGMEQIKRKCLGDPLYIISKPACSSAWLSNDLLFLASANNHFSAYELNDEYNTSLLLCQLILDDNLVSLVVNKNYVSLLTVPSKILSIFYMNLGIC